MLIIFLFVFILIFNVVRWGSKIRFCLYIGKLGLRWDSLNKVIVFVYSIIKLVCVMWVFNNCLDRFLNLIFFFSSGVFLFFVVLKD